MKVKKKKSTCKLILYKLIFVNFIFCCANIVNFHVFVTHIVKFHKIYWEILLVISWGEQSGFELGFCKIRKTEKRNRISYEINYGFSPNPKHEFHQGKIKIIKKPK